MPPLPAVCCVTLVANARGPERERAGERDGLDGPVGVEGGSGSGCGRVTEDRRRPALLSSRPGNHLAFIYPISRQTHTRVSAARPSCPTDQPSAPPAPLPPEPWPRQRRPTSSSRRSTGPSTRSNTTRTGSSRRSSDPRSQRAGTSAAGSPSARCVAAPPPLALPLSPGCQGCVAKELVPPRCTGTDLHRRVRRALGRPAPVVPVRAPLRSRPAPLRSGHHVPARPSLHSG